MISFQDKSKKPSISFNGNQGVSWKTFKIDENCHNHQDFMYEWQYHWTLTHLILIALQSQLTGLFKNIIQEE